MWNLLIEKTLQAILKRQVRRRPPRPFNLSAMDRVNRILLMTTTAIGDTLFSTPAIRAVKETYPQKTVHVLCHIRQAPLLRHNPFCDRLFCTRGKAKGVFSLVKELRRQDYDLVVVLHGNDPESIPLARATGAPCLIGSGASRFAFLLSEGVICRDEFRHAIERRLDLVRVIGADTVEKRMDLFLSPDWEAKTDRLLTEAFGDDRSPLIGIHPTGSGGYKWWPAENYALLADWLRSRYRARFVLFSSKREADVIRGISSRIGGPVLLAGGRYDLAAVAGLIKKCAFFVSNDSGPMHMALALGVPVLALIGADSPRRIGPYQTANAQVLYKKPAVCDVPHCLNRRCPDNRCLKSISPAEAEAAVEAHFKEYLENPVAASAGVRRAGAARHS